jgi:GAF domain-containing protein/pyridoxamine 5'-phosphate oxidase-like protein
VTEVDLRSIRASLQGVIPSPFATCSPDGMPNVTYLSLVAYVDAERVAISRQFLSKSRVNLDANPRAQVIVVDPASAEQHVLDLRHLHTETEGETYESMRANLDAVASQTGMGDVFRLRGVDVFRVERCERVGAAPVLPAPREDLLEPVEQLVRRLAGCASYEEVARVALEALDDQLGLRHAILLAHDAAGGRLFAIASTGYEASAVGAEVEVGDGLIGTAALRRRLVVQSSLQRSRAMAQAVTRDAADPREVPLPGLASARSAAAVPLPLGGELLGVLYIESERAAAFVGSWEPALRLIGGHLAAALAARGAPAEDPHHVAGPPAVASGAAVAITHYAADDTVLCDGEYIVKGIPGRILWTLLREHAATGRTAFSNRELRLDESLGLPAGNDNLEARLLVLRRRLAERGSSIGLQRVGRGRLELTVTHPLRLEEIPTAGPWDRG